MNSVFEKYYQDGLIIDIGCGWGTKLPKADVLFDKATYIAGQPTVATCYGDFHDMHMFEDNMFGYVFSHHSIEHAKRPEVALKEWVRILKPSGILHIVWPGWLEHRDPKEWSVKLSEPELLAAENYEEYIKKGYDPNWVSTSWTGSRFLDGHYNILNLQQMLDILPKNMVILETLAEGDTVVVAKKHA